MDGKSGQLSRRCGNSMNRQDEDTLTGMRFKERTRIQDKVRCTERSDQLYIGRMMLVAERG